MHLPIAVELVAQSDSLRPHRLWPARLLCSWNSPGKSTGVGCHSVLHGDLPDSGMEPWSHALQADCLPSELPGNPAYQLLNQIK